MGRRFVILGNGIAGLTAAHTIRLHDDQAEILIVSEETIATYSRPLLSKTFFKTFNKYKTIIHDQQWYEQNRIGQRYGSKVIRISADTKTIILADGSSLYFDKCIYALGAGCFVPPFQGVEKKGVYVVRTFGDFENIRRAMAAATSAVIIGGGVIGLEMAHELNQLDCQVTVLEAAPRLIGRLIDEESAILLTEIIRRSGIEIHTGVQIQGMTGDDKVTGVALADGIVHPADLVIVSCGVRANIQPARESGIDCDRGVLVNDYMETSLPDIYAAGDCIQTGGLNPGLWRYALRSAETAGVSAVYGDQREPFIPLPEAVIMTVADTSLFICGSTELHDGILTEVTTVLPDQQMFKVNRINRMADGYQKLFYEGNQLKGAVLIGDLAALSVIKRQIEGGGQQ